MTGPIKVLSSASIAVLALAATATAQNVSISSAEITIRNSLQDEVVKITSGADYDAGGGTFNADMTLRNTFGDILFDYAGGTGDQIGRAHV